MEATSGRGQERAGWFPDPLGRFAARFWDGTWTSHVKNRWRVLRRDPAWDASEASRPAPEDGWYRDPAHRFQRRYREDGFWTEHVTDLRDDDVVADDLKGELTDPLAGETFELLGEDDQIWGLGRWRLWLAAGAVLLVMNICVIVSGIVRTVEFTEGLPFHYQAQLLAEVAFTPFAALIALAGALALSAVKFRDRRTQSLRWWIGGTLASSIVIAAGSLFIAIDTRQPDYGSSNGVGFEAGGLSTTAHVATSLYALGAALVAVLAAVICAVALAERPASGAAVEEAESAAPVER